VAFSWTPDFTLRLVKQRQCGEKDTGRDKLAQSYSSPRVKISILAPAFMTFVHSEVFLTA